MSAGYMNLPFELRLQIVELSPMILISLLEVDEDLAKYFYSEEGQNWMYRALGKTYDTAYEKGFKLADKLKHGPWEYNRNRFPKIENYIFGVLQNSTGYYANGVSQKIPYVNGKINGNVIVYDKFGAITKISPYINDKLNGNVIKYYPSGSVAKIKQYINNLPNGYIIEYDDTLVPKITTLQRYIYDISCVKISVKETIYLGDCPLRAPMKACSLLSKIELIYYMYELGITFDDIVLPPNVIIDLSVIRKEVGRHENVNNFTRDKIFYYYKLLPHQFTKDFMCEKIREFLNEISTQYFLVAKNVIV